MTRSNKKDNKSCQLGIINASQPNTEDLSLLAEAPRSKADQPAKPMQPCKKPPPSLEKDSIMERQKRREYSEIRHPQRIARRQVLRVDSPGDQIDRSLVRRQVALWRAGKAAGTVNDDIAVAVNQVA